MMTPRRSENQKNLKRDESLRKRTLVWLVARDLRKPTHNYVVVACGLKTATYLNTKAIQSTPQGTLRYLPHCTSYKISEGPFFNRNFLHMTIAGAAPFRAQTGTVLAIDHRHFLQCPRVGKCW